MKNEAALEISGLTVRYGKLTAVEEVSLEVPKGSVYALLGRNGSGKSSTVRCLLGQRRASAGTARVFGLDAWKKRTSIMDLIGVVPEQPDIPPESNAEALSRFMVRVTPRWRSAEFFSRLENFGIPRRRRFDKLSKGQQRQMALALALATSPKLLVLDDPTLGLDAIARRELFEELIGDLADRGTTVFLTTHDLAGVEGIADRVGVLNSGSLLVDEGLEELKARFCSLTLAPPTDIGFEAIAESLHHLGLVSLERSSNAIEAVVEEFSEVGFGKFRDEVSVEVLKVQSLPLEEIFITLCGENGGSS